MTAEQCIGLLLCPADLAMFDCTGYPIKWLEQMQQVSIRHEVVLSQTQPQGQECTGPRPVRGPP